MLHDMLAKSADQRVIVGSVTPGLLGSDRTRDVAAVESLGDHAFKSELGGGLPERVNRAERHGAGAGWAGRAARGGRDGAPTADRPASGRPPAGDGDGQLHPLLRARTGNQGVKVGRPWRSSTTSSPSTSRSGPAASSASSGNRSVRSVPWRERSCTPSASTRTSARHPSILGSPTQPPPPGNGAWQGCIGRSSPP